MSLKPLWAAVLALGVAGCEDAYPEVVVINLTGDSVQLRDVSFNGCLWTDILGYGEATSPQKCPPGSDRVHFKKLDTSRSSGQEAPLWFNYQTISEHKADYGDFQRIEVTLTDIEQDFSIPGPYGH
jgi:hypothetical protein